MTLSAVRTKWCRDCRSLLPVTAFARNLTERDGLMRACKRCDQARNRAYYWENRESVLAKAAARAKPRFCRVCGEPTRTRKSPYCQKHAEEALDRRVQRRFRRNMSQAELERARERERARQRAPRPWHSTRYGQDHRALRAQIDEQVRAGLAVCWRCRKPISPNEPWDLGHVDGDPSRYAGPEHRACNRATAGRKRKAERTSRRW